MKDLYDDYYRESLSQSKSQSLSRAAFDRSARKFRWNYKKFFFKISKDVPVLDIGCGVGQFLYFLKKDGFTNIYGIDISSSQVDLARKMVPDANISHDRDTIEFLRSHPEAFAVITMNDVLEHIPTDSLSDFMNAAHSALTTDGVLVIKTVNAAYPLSNAGRYMDLTHTTAFTEKSLIQLLRHTGFRDIACYQEEIGIYNPLFLLKKAVVVCVRLFLRSIVYFSESDWPRIISVNVIARGKK